MCTLVFQYSAAPCYNDEAFVVFYLHWMQYKYHHTNEGVQQQ